MTHSPAIFILQDPSALYHAAAEEFVRRAEEAVHARGRFTVALSGGSTPRGVHGVLASEPFRSRVAWEGVEFFWGDERHVPPDHPDSNYRMAWETLLSKVPVPPEHVHRVPAENADAGQAAADYERTLREFFNLSPGEWPRFDLVFLGMGPEGHTASLFPGSPALHEEQRLVAAPWVEKFNTFRITLTSPALNHSAAVAFLVSGAEKAETVRAVLEGPHQPDELPAQAIRPVDGELLWLIDRAAGSLFTGGPPERMENAK